MIENETGELVPNPAYNREEDGDYICCYPCGGITSYDSHFHNILQTTNRTAQATTVPVPIQLQPQSNPAPFMNQVAPQQQTPATPFAPPTYEQSGCAPPTYAPPAYAPPAY